MAERGIKYGNDFFREIKSNDSKVNYNAYYWDLWIALILTNKFDNNWDALISAIKSNKSYPSDKYMAISNHIKNLNKELTNLGFDASDILADVDADFLKKQNLKAKKKVLDLDFQNSEKTEWMINTPKKLLYEKALNGNWYNFPVNPTQFATELETKFKKTDYYRKGETHKLEDKLQAFLNKNTKTANNAKLIAVYRAFLSVVITKMDMIDDSYGVIGSMYQEVFELYLNIDRQELNMPPDVFLLDILELIIWEDYGGIDVYETIFFEKLSPNEVIIVESILRDEIEMLWSLELEYQAENALTALSILYAKQKMFDKFVPLAKEMETRHWHRITILAETAIDNGRRDLALQVFEACLVAGNHYNFLKEKYEKLKNQI